MESYRAVDCERAKTAFEALADIGIELRRLICVRCITEPNRTEPNRTEPNRTEAVQKHPVKA